jgi:uncharacterized protein (TIRG00374 family)
MSRMRALMHQKAPTMETVSDASKSESKLKTIFGRLWSSKAFRYGAGTLVSLLALYLALRNVDFDQVGNALRAADYRLVALALFSVAFNQLARAYRWRVLLGASPPGKLQADDRRKRFSLFDLLLSLLSAQLLNTVYPARLGDLSRAYVIGSRGPGKVFTLGTVVLEKLLDTLAYGAFFLVMLLTLPLPGWVGGSVSTFALATVLATLAVVVLAYRPQIILTLLGRLFARFPGRISQSVQFHLQDGMESLRTLRDRSELARALIWTALIWATAVFNNALILQAMHLRLPWMAPFFVLVVLQVGISLPSTPGSLGVFEYACVLALSLFSVGSADALGFGFVLHAVVFLPVIVFGFLAFLYLGLNVNQVAAPGQADMRNDLVPDRTQTSAENADKV